MKKILLVDDEIEILELIELYLSNEDVDIYKAADGISALNIIDQETIDLAVIDVMMPKMNGFQLIKTIRTKSQMPIIVLSARDKVHDKISGLNLGADDYMTKPFDTMELIARIQANLRRRHNDVSQVNEVVEFKDLAFDSHSMVVSKSDMVLDLTSIEVKIMRCFFENINKVLTKKQLYEFAWEENYYGDENAVRVHMSNLRDKLSDCKESTYIKTIRGLGYIMKRENQ